MTKCHTRVEILVPKLMFEELEHLSVGCHLLVHTKSTCILLQSCSTIGALEEEVFMCLNSILAEGAYLVLYI